MRLIEGLAALDALDLEAQYGDSLEARSAVLVGVFDGVHLGHQRLLHELLELASTVDALPTVVTFRNHPDELLSGKAPEPLISFEHRLRLMRRFGVRRVLSLTFDDELRRLSAGKFAERILARGLCTRGLLLGYDTAFGKNRDGTPEHLRELGERLGFSVQTSAPFLVDGSPASSSMIREAITAGDLALSQRLLGRFVSTLGTVVHGDQRGRELGFPTANLSPEPGVLPPEGVYAVEVVLDGCVYQGVANLGARPTFEPASASLEVHVLDFSGDLYERILELGFVARLRDQRRFESRKALCEQIEADVLCARRILSS